MKNKGFTLVELLIVVGILATITVITVALLNPTEFAAQGRDGVRVNNLKVLDDSVVWNKLFGGVDNTNENLVYISLPDTNSNGLCDEYSSLPTPSGCSYRCLASETNLRKIDGTGWLPIDFTRITTQTPPLNALAVDSLNNASSGNYYAYSKKSETNYYSFFAKLESDKYKNGLALNDGGYIDDTFETKPAGCFYIAWRIPAGGIAGQWGNLLRNTYHTGTNPSAPSVAGTPKWSYANGTGTWIAIADDGTIYTSNASNNVYALNTDGTQRWSYTKTFTAFRSPPVIAQNGNLYFITNNGDIIVLSSSGSLLYEDTITIASAYSKTPTIDTSGNLYIFNGSGTLYSFNPDLSLKWQRSFTLPSGYSVNSSYSALSVAIASDGTLYFYDGRYLKALYPSDGSDKWSYDVVGSPPVTITYGSPSIASDGTIYAVHEGCVKAINPNNTTKWQNCLGNFAQYTSPVIAPNGDVYTVRNGDYVSAFNPANGVLRWQYTISPGGYESIPVFASDNTAYYYDANSGQLHAINPNGTQKWVRNVGGSSAVGLTPAVANNGTVYVSEFVNGLSAYGN